MIHESLKDLEIDIESIHPDPANARKHPERNMMVIKASLEQFGQRKPIVIRKDDMTITAGNGTFEAAKALGWTTIAAVVCDDDMLTATKFALVDNRSAELAEWDMDNLSQLTGALLDQGESLGPLGWNDDEIGALGEFGLRDEDGDAMPDLNPIIRYEIIFDTIDQQDRFFRFMKTLKEQYPEAETAADRLDHFLEGQADGQG